MPYTQKQVDEINEWYRLKDEESDRLEDELDALRKLNTGQHKDESGQWCCNECNQQINNHLSTCETHKEYLVWYRVSVDAAEKSPTRPWWMCQGCDQPQEGAHRFGCHFRGSQMSVPAIKLIDGKYQIFPPPLDE
jgi:hypothetical protein